MGMDLDLLDEEVVIMKVVKRVKEIYLNYAKYNLEPEKAFRGNYPEWKFMDKVSNSWTVNTWPAATTVGA